VDSEYRASLSKLYLEFAESEADQYDWFDSTYFAEKGLLVANGANVSPENLGDWDLPPEIIDDMTHAREYLTKALDEDNKDRLPDLSARALFLYDCWVEQQEENWQVEHIESCREEFYDVLDRLLEKSKENAEIKLTELTGVRNLDAGEKEKAAIEAISDEPATLTYMVFFDFGSTKLDKQSKETVNNVIEDIRALEGKYEIIINGHADRAGNQKTNLHLSHKRAKTVKSKFVKAGINKKAVQIFSFGESDPRIDTADGEKNRMNRRVEIIVTE
jgi:OOP family OmpA-OmpF porin